MWIFSLGALIWFRSRQCSVVISIPCYRMFLTSKSKYEGEGFYLKWTTHFQTIRIFHVPTSINSSTKSNRNKRNIANLIQTVDLWFLRNNSTQSKFPVLRFPARCNTCQSKNKKSVECLNPKQNKTIHLSTRLCSVFCFIRDI